MAVKTTAALSQQQQNILSQISNENSTPLCRLSFAGTLDMHIRCLLILLLLLNDATAVLPVVTVTVGPSKSARQPEGCCCWPKLPAAVASCSGRSSSGHSYTLYIVPTCSSNNMIIGHFILVVQPCELFGHAHATMSMLVRSQPSAPKFAGFCISQNFKFQTF